MSADSSSLSLKSLLMVAPFEFVTPGQNRVVWEFGTSHFLKFPDILCGDHGIMENV
jgi:hypothetical protein